MRFRWTIPTLILAMQLFAVAGSAAEPGTTGLRLDIYRDPVEGWARSGDGQTGLVNAEFPEPLRVTVRDGNGDPVDGVVVRFKLIEPSERLLGEATTGGGGLASFNFVASSKNLPHSVTARILGAADDEAEVVFHLQVRRRTWTLFLVFGLAGGLGLFLFGMNLMSNALQRSAGRRLRSILSKLTANRFVGLAVGAFVTVLVQSSSATTVMLVSFVQARLLTFAQTLGVILGADIGTTVTAQLIAFKLTDYALLLIAVGFGLRLLARTNRISGVGDVILGFGILFFGMQVMSESMRPLRTYLPFMESLAQLENPFLGILLGTLFTALIQSSAALIGIVIVLAQQGLLTLESGIPLMLGANIGTCITALLASIGADRPARRVAMAHTGFKVFGVIMMAWWIPAFADLVRSVSPGAQVATGDPEALARIVPREIANAHTIFNVGLALLCLPFTGVVARLVERILPDRAESEPEWTVKARHLDKEMIKVPALALNLAKVEILRLGERVKGMAVQCLEAFVDKGDDTIDALHQAEEEVDALDEQVTAYLLSVGRQKLSEEQIREVYLMLHVTKQFEHMADIIDKQIRPLAVKMMTRNAEFSATGQAEVASYHRKMCKQISRALETFQEGSLELAKHMKTKQRSYIALEEAYRQAHFERVHQAVAESLATSEIHLELMDCFRRISSYSTNVGRAIMTAASRDESDYGLD